MEKEDREGESVRYLIDVCRSHFEAAQKAWKEQGPLSELFVIIIDEIDAICKPRGWSTQTQSLLLPTLHTHSHTHSSSLTPSLPLSP